uniref:Uncharacterized protein n=1 Tax=Favella ehrenbergii TaxID=182087 RepID=A0A7S3I365_9SPIT|mmetsp:Transcript_31573/g.39275  ORF Transcript_31573/g.39275 Transcript_31573/m.39275 type:complete len:127 (+) Transcript_31573:961-1341(+)
MPPKGGKSSHSVGSWLPVLNEGAPVSDANPGFFIFSLSFSSALLSKSLKCYLLFCVKISPDALAASAFFWAAAAEGDAGLGPPAGAASFFGLHLAHFKNDLLKQIHHLWLRQLPLVEVKWVSLLEI